MPIQICCNTWLKTPGITGQDTIHSTLRPLLSSTSVVLHCLQQRKAFVILSSCSQKSNSWKAAAGQCQIQTRSNSLLFMQPKDQLHRRKFQWHSFNLLLMLRSQRPHCLSGVSEKHAKHSHDPKYTPCNDCRVKHYAWTSWLGFCLYWCHGKDKQDLLIQNCYTGCCGTET